MSGSVRLSLTKPQRNKVTERAVSLGFDARSFEWSEVPSGDKGHCLVSLLRHTPSGGFFRFDRHAQHGYMPMERPFWCVWSPGTRQVTESVSTYGPDHQIALALEWLGS
jgi:hypothetical protein